jgi:hypothetical protein
MFIPVIGSNRQLPRTFQPATGHWICGHGADTDSERAIRWPIALMVLCCDPLAIALTAAASARR